MFEALILSAALQFGMLGGAAYCYGPTGTWEYAECPPLYATLEARAEYGVLFADASVRTDMLMISATSYDPYDLAFQVEGGLCIGSLTIAMRHTCYHPMMTYSLVDGYRIMPVSEGATDDVYIRVSIGGRGK